MSPTDRRQVYCGLESRDEAPRISLSEDERVSSGARIGFFVDSIIRFPSGLAVAKQGIRWFPIQMTVSDLQSDLHLRPRQVTYFDTAGIQHQVHRPVHKIPHYTYPLYVKFFCLKAHFFAYVRRLIDPCWVLDAIAVK
ncbi:hypothetical protein BKA56DRAFT_500124 [Ilyonectria sp. MPI-CAGE-AT-0026]|nr:hypothetical protein BKA56DRAFT_500124 [Ilyonectria sp. MPI-CAGE-AT-0026]